MIGRREGSPPFEDVAQGAARHARGVRRGGRGEEGPREPDHGLPEDPRRHPRRSRRSASSSTTARASTSSWSISRGRTRSATSSGATRRRRCRRSPSEDFAKYKDGVAAIYVEADRILGEIAARAPRRTARRSSSRRTTASGTGADRPDARVRDRSSTRRFSGTSRPASSWRRGRASSPSPTRGKASVFDLAPTLCRLLGLPADPAFEGKLVPGFTGRPAVPAAAWAKAAPVERLVARDERAPRTRRRPPTSSRRSSSRSATSRAPRPRPWTRGPPDRAGTETAGSFQNVGTFLRDRGKPAEAVGWYRKALEVNPKSATAWMNLSTALHQTRQVRRVRRRARDRARERLLRPGGTVYRRVKLYTDGREGTRPAPAAARVLPEEGRRGVPEGGPLPRLAREGALRDGRLRGGAAALRGPRGAARRRTRRT